MATEFILIGDSNSGAVGQAARRAQHPFIGGPVANGRRADDLFFDVEEDGKTAFHDDVGQNTRFSCEDLLDASKPILSTLGFNTQRIGRELHAYLREQGITIDNLSDAVLDQGLEDYKAGPLAYYREAIRRGARVYATYSPQRFPDSYFETAMRLESLFAAKLSALGVTMIAVRAEPTDAQGRLLPELATDREGDQTHANADWGMHVLDRFADLSAA